MDAVSGITSINSNKIIFDSGPFFPTPTQTSNYICSILNINNNYIDYNLQSVISSYWKLEGYNLKNLFCLSELPQVIRPNPRLGLVKPFQLVLINLTILYYCDGFL